MHITPIKTDKITYPAPNITALIDQYIPKISDRSIIVITSKVVSICQGDVIKNDGSISKEDLIQKESEYYLNNHPLYPGIFLTIANTMLIASAGIDESNGNGYFVLWPKNIQETTNTIREHVVTKHGIKHVGVLITDSHTTPLRWGTTGIALSYSGFAPLKNYIGVKDIFDKEMRVTQANIADGLAAAAVATMGEGAEQTPFALITDTDFVAFSEKNPTKEELQTLHISREEDLYAPLINSTKWKTGGKKK